jgi:hypothetical protein
MSWLLDSLSVLLLIGFYYGGRLIGIISDESISVEKQETAPYTMVKNVKAVKRKEQKTSINKAKAHLQ